VNEVTLFRIFGSKDAFLDEGIQQSSSDEPRTPLPSAPVDPALELTVCVGGISPASVGDASSCCGASPTAGIRGAPAS
jgi:hypothetical protein